MPCRAWERRNPHGDDLLDLLFHRRGIAMERANRCPRLDASWRLALTTIRGGPPLLIYALSNLWTTQKEQSSICSNLYTGTSKAEAIAQRVFKDGAL